MESNIGSLLNRKDGFFNPEENDINLVINRSGVDHSRKMKYEQHATSSTQRYLSAEGFTFKAGDKLTITMPFTTTKNVLLKYGDITSGCMVSDAVITEAALFAKPEPTAGLGNDKASVSLWSVGWYTSIMSNLDGNYVFTSESPTTLNNTFLFTAPLYLIPHPAGSWQKEARIDKMPYAKMVTLTIPDGYTLEKLEFKSPTKVGLVEPSVTMLKNASTVEISGNTYTFDLTGIYVDTENAFIAGQNIPKPGRSSYLYIIPTIKASKNASSLRQPVSAEVEFENAGPGGYGASISTIRVTPTFQYVGVSSELKSTISELPASTTVRQIPLTVGNPNTFAMQNNYLYITGDITYPDAVNLKLKGTGTNLGIDGTVVGGGTGYCWIKLSDIPMGESQDYLLDFLYSGGSTGGNISVHLVSEYNGVTPLPAGLTDASFDLTLDANKTYLGGSKTISIVAATATLGGSVSVDKTELKLDDTAPYTVKAALNSRGSKSEIMNPVIELTIPKGFKYKPNTAKIYWGGTNKPLVAADETELQDATANTAGENTFTLQVVNTWKNAGTNFILPVTGNDNALEVYLEAEFILDCATGLYNVYFKNDLSGQTVYADPVATIPTLFSNGLAAKLQPAEIFDIRSELAGNVFTKDQKKVEYKVTINRQTGYGSMATEKLVIELPETLNIESGKDITATGGITATPTFENTPIAGVRTITITLPYAAMNVMADKKAEVTYTIPLESSFDGTGALLTDPEKTITAYVTTAMSLPGCSNVQPFQISEENKTNILFFAFDGSPYKVSAGKTYEVVSTTTGTGISGNLTVAGETPIAANTGKWTYSPVATTATGVKASYIEPVYNGTTYGKVNFTVEVFPSLEYTLDPPDEGCTSISYTPAQFEGLLSATQTGVTYAFYASNSGGSLSVPVSTTQTIGLGTTSYWVQSDNGFEKGDPKEILFTVNTPITITALDPAIVNLEGDASTTITIPVSGTKDGNGNYTYTLFKNAVQEGSPVSKPDASHGFVQSFLAPTTAAFDTYTYYATVLGSASCGLATSSDVDVNVYPLPVIAIDNSKAIAFCSTDATLPTIQLDAYVAGGLNTTQFSYTYSLNGAAEAGLTSSVRLSNTPGIYNYILYAKNKLTESTKIAQASVTITVYAPVELDPVTPLVELEGASNTTIVATPAAGSGAADTYKLYQMPGSSLVNEQSTGSFNVSFPAPTNTAVAYEEYTYYITAQGALSCALYESNEVVVKVYPIPAIGLTTLPRSYCEDNTALQDGIDLWEYVDSQNETWFTYTYSEDGGSTWSSLAAGSHTIPTGVGTHNYKLKAVNKLSGSSEEAVEDLQIIVEKKTVINSVDGYEVTEGEAVNIVVSAVGEKPLSYLWQKWDGSNWQTITGATSESYQLTPSVHINENGDRYRVTVNGFGNVSGCNSDAKEFTLKVKPAITPPLGNNKVSWEVIGYGNVSVTADGISISNGSHVNNGTKLVITGTTWKSNILKSITINGTEYTNSSVSYTVNGSSVHIVVEFLGSDPNPDPDSNAEIESGTRIWTEGGSACIYTETAGRVRILTFNGRLVTDQRLPEGESRIQLPDGYYIVTLSDGTTQKIAVRNF